MHNYIWCPIYIPSFLIIGSVVSEELRWQGFGTDGQADEQTDGVTVLLDLLSPSATQVKMIEIWNIILDIYILLDLCIINNKNKPANIFICAFWWSNFVVYSMYFWFRFYKFKIRGFTKWCFHHTVCE